MLRICAHCEYLIADLFLTPFWIKNMEELKLEYLLDIKNLNKSESHSGVNCPNKVGEFQILISERLFE